MAVAATIALGGAAGWYGALYAIPYVATDQLFAKFEKNGSEVNVLLPTRLRDSRRNNVPLDNADTLVRAAMIDLSAGPLLFEAQVPGDGEYWSVSVFAHNTDTLFVANDQELGPGKFSLAIRRSDQSAPQAEKTVIVPGNRAFLLIRSVMTDRTDLEEVESLKAQLSRASLTRAVPAGRTAS